MLLRDTVFVRPVSTKSLPFRIAEATNTMVKGVAFYKHCGEHLGGVFISTPLLTNDLAHPSVFCPLSILQTYVVVQVSAENNVLMP